MSFVFSSRLGDVILSYGLRVKIHVVNISFPFRREYFDIKSEIDRHLLTSLQIAMKFDFPEVEVRP